MYTFTVVKKYFINKKEMIDRHDNIEYCGGGSSQSNQVSTIVGVCARLICLLIPNG